MAKKPSDSAKRQVASQGKKPKAGVRLPDPQQAYDLARQLAEDGRTAQAERTYQELARALAQGPLAALVANDLGTLAFLRGDRDAARDGFRRALRLDPDCEVAEANLAIIEKPPAQPDLATRKAVGTTPPQPEGEDAHFIR